MFRSNNNALVAPVTTPIFNAPEAAADISAYLGEFRATDNNTIATIGGMLLVITTNAVSNDPSDLRTNVRNLFTGDSYNAVHALMSANAAAANSDNGRNVVAIRANVGAATNWLINLINAAKKKPLTEGNVEGFFAMMGHTSTRSAVVAQFINSIQVFFPDEINDHTFREELAPGIWTTYRNSRVSAGTIINKLLPDFRIMNITRENDANERAVIACAASPWDLELSLAIPEKLKAYAAIYLDVSGTPIEKWYQGNKAVDELPSSKVRKLKEIFRKYNELKSDVGDINAIANIRDFSNNANIAAFLQ